MNAPSRVVYADVPDNFLGQSLERLFRGEQFSPGHEIAFKEVNRIDELSELAGEGADLLLLFASNLATLASSEHILDCLERWKRRDVPMLGWWAWSLTDYELWQKLEELGVPLLSWPADVNELLRAMRAVMDGSASIPSLTEQRRFR